MSEFAVMGLTLLAVVMCWSVGAHNRLVQLRTAMRASFAPLAAHLQERQALIYSLAQVALERHGCNADRVQTAQAASLQAAAALGLASPHPGSPGVMTSLALAEHVLDDAWARLVTKISSPEPWGPEPQPLTTITANLAFTRQLFNTAVSRYNQAVQQFPTCLLSRLWGLSPVLGLPDARAEQSKVPLEPASILQA
jgi:LemA protein